MKSMNQKRTTVLNSHLPTNMQYNVTEAYKVARTNLDFSIIKDGCKKIVITSSLASEGKSTTSVNVAISLAQQVNVKVLLIDCDLRKPRLHRFFGLKNTPGLTNYFGKMCDLEDVIKPTENPNLFMICSGVSVPNSSELLACDAMPKLLNTLENDYDYIIIDTSPINVVIDAMPLVKLADGVVLVVREGVSTHTQLTKTIESLEWVDAKIAGIILNGAKMDQKSNYKYYYEKYE